KLDKEVQVFKEAYGEGKYDKKQYENYKTNKINDLYKRMGNAFLQEMKAYDKEQKRIHHMKKSKPFQK
ncbi:relaxase MobL, partial [Bacillus toyonensis]